MGVPTSEVGYSSATAIRGNHEVHDGQGWHWIKKKKGQRFYFNAANNFRTENLFSIKY
jgi:hypothetical protein